MSDDEVDLELLQLLRQRLGISEQTEDYISADTGVLEDAEFIYNNAVDVSIDMWSTQSAALKIWKTIEERGYSIQAWSEHELHPKLGEEFNEVEMANFVFTMDLLNFSFWSELSENDRFQVEYQGKRWTGYMSLVACLRRALSEGTPITTPRFWRQQHCSDEVIRHVFRSATDEPMPLLAERIAILREAGEALKEFDNVSDDTLDDGAIAEDDRDGGAVLQSPVSALHTEGVVEKRGLVADDQKDFQPSSVAIPEEAAIDDEATNTAADERRIDVSTENSTSALQAKAVTKGPDLSIFASATDESVKKFVLQSDKSAGRLVNLLMKHFPSFRDESRYEGRRVRLLKRAQICVADLHAACNGQGIGEFLDIDKLTMFADYRVPQILHRFGVLSYCPALLSHIQRKLPLEHSGSWEVQIRGCSIWATELLRRAICRHIGAESVNAVLIDFLLYDLAKEWEFEKESIPHHRTRSTSY